MTLQDVYETWYSKFDDNYDGSFFISYLYTQSDCLERLSIINVLKQIHDGKIACINKDNIRFDFSDYFTDNSQDGLTLNHKIKKELLINVSSAYGWEMLTVEQTYRPFAIFAQMLMNEVDCSYNRHFDFINRNSDLYGLCFFSESYKRCIKKCDTKFLRFAQRKLKNSTGISLPKNIIKQLIFTEDITDTMSYTILKIKKKRSISSDFFDSIHQTYRYGWLPFVELCDSYGYYYLIIRSYWVDDLNCRMSDTVDLRFLDLNAFSLFDDFCLMNQ